MKAPPQATAFPQNLPVLRIQGCGDFLQQTLGNGLAAALAITFRATHFARFAKWLSARTCASNCFYRRVLGKGDQLRLRSVASARLKLRVFEPVVKEPPPAPLPIVMTADNPNSRVLQNRVPESSKGTTVANIQMPVAHLSIAINAARRTRGFSLRSPSAVAPGSSISIKANMIECSRMRAARRKLDWAGIDLGRSVEESWNGHRLANPPQGLGGHASHLLVLICNNGSKGAIAPPSRHRLMELGGNVANGIVVVVESAARGLSRLSGIDPRQRPKGIPPHLHGCGIPQGSCQNLKGIAP